MATMTGLLSSKILQVALLFLVTWSTSINAIKTKPPANGVIKRASPVSEYVVPTEGAFETLPPPDAKATLTFLTIARGNISYSCNDRNPDQPPVYISQYTSLWDAAPLIPHIADESQFHTIIPQLFDFDYTEIANSSLICIGDIATLEGYPLVEIFSVETFRLNIQRTIQAPDHSKSDLGWAYEISEDRKWQVYRVETISDTLPALCEGLPKEFDLKYAAEYWFYHD